MSATAGPATAAPPGSAAVVGGMEAGQSGASSSRLCVEFWLSHLL